MFGLSQSSSSLRELPVSAVLSEAGRYIEVKAPVFAMTGDVSRAFYVKGGILLILTDEENADTSVAVKVTGKDFSPDDYKGHKVCVTGHFKVKPGDISLYFDAEDIEDLGVSGKEEKLKEWDEYCSEKGWYRDEEEQKSFRCSFDQVGLIANRKSHGYADFIKKLNPEILNEEEDLFLYNTTMTAGHIIEGINYFNRKKNVDCICIVRGGGSFEELLPYSTPVLVKAVAESQIPVICGIGHSNDIILAAKAASFNGGTPTGAAMFFNRMADSEEFGEIRHSRARWALLACILLVALACVLYKVFF